MKTVNKQTVPSAAAGARQGRASKAGAAAKSLRRPAGRPPVSPATRGRMLDVAAHIFAAEGPAALTVRRLAQELGSSTMSLYSHFSGKAQLIDATADEFVIRFSEALKAVPRSDDPLADFIALSNSYRAISLANRDLYKVAMARGRLSISRDQPTGIRGLFDYCADAIGRCIERGQITATDDPRAGLLVFWTAVHGQVMLETEAVFADQAAADAAWARCLDAVARGLQRA